jgi:hypothetical protein
MAWRLFQPLCQFAQTRSAILWGRVRYCMCRFLPEDPPEFYDPATKIQTFLHHEAGHLLLAYYYGLEIGGFRYAFINGELTGAVRNRPSAAVQALGVTLATRLETQKCLAGELAGRIHCGAPTNRMVLVLDGQDPETLNANTPFADLDLIPQPGQDTYKAITLFIDRKIPENWWNWMWGCHDAAEQILRDNWPLVEQLAERLAHIPPYANEKEKADHKPSGAVDGQTLIDWCEEIGAPIHNPSRASVAY